MCLTWQTGIVDIQVADDDIRCACVIGEGGSLEEVRAFGPVVTGQLQQQPLVRVAFLHRLSTVFWVRRAAGALVTLSRVGAVLGAVDDNGSVV